MKQLHYKGVFEVGESEPETAHDCTKPKQEPSLPKAIELAGGEEWQLGASNSKRSRLTTEERYRNRAGSDPNVI